MKLQYGQLDNGMIYVSTHEVTCIDDEVTIDRHSWTFLYPSFARGLGQEDLVGLYGPCWFHHFAPPPSLGLSNWIHRGHALADGRGQPEEITRGILTALQAEYPEFKPTARQLLQGDPAVSIEIQHTADAPFLSHVVRFADFWFAFPTSEKPDVACWFDNTAPFDAPVCYVDPPNETLKALIENYVANPASAHHALIADALQEQYGSTELRKGLTLEAFVMGHYSEDTYVTGQYQKAVDDEAKGSN